jgi:hypothetical protein
MAATATEPRGGRLTGRPWELFGWSRGRWENLRRAGLTPQPLALPGERQWRITDLLRWIEDLPTRDDEA